MSAVREYKTIARRQKSQRSNAGIVLPEFALFSAVKPFVQSLVSGSYADDSHEEDIISSLSGMAPSTIDQIFGYLKNNPVKFNFSFPLSRVELPSITLVLESMSPVGELIGDDGGVIDEEMSTDTNITLVSSASGGETVFYLPHHDISPATTTLHIERAGQSIDLFSTYDEFSVTAAGKVTLATPLQAGDKLVCDSVVHYGLPGGDIFWIGFSFSTVFFIDTLNPLITSALSGLLWRELMTKRDALNSVGLLDFSVSKRAQSLWEATNPALGFRTELVATGIVEWAAYKRFVSPRTLNVDLDGTDGSDSVVFYSDDIAALGINQFEDEV